MSNDVKVREMDNETSMKYLTEMYGQTLAGVKILSGRIKATGLARVMQIYAGLPFVKPEKSPQSQDEVILLQGLIKLADLRSAMLELVTEEGKVKPNENDANEPSNSSSPNSEESTGS